MSQIKTDCRYCLNNKSKIIEKVSTFQNEFTTNYQKGFPKKQHLEYFPMQDSLIFFIKLIIHLFGNWAMVLDLIQIESW